MRKSTEHRTAGAVANRSPVLAAVAAALAAAVALPVAAQGFQAPDVEVTEGDDASFEVTLPHGLNAAVRWAYETENGTASGNDYTAASGYLVVDAGDTTGAVAVTTADDNVADDGETFKLRLFGFQMQRASGQWSAEAVYGIPGERTITATIKDGS